MLLRKNEILICNVNGIIEETLIVVVRSYRSKCIDFHLVKFVNNDSFFIKTVLLEYATHYHKKIID